jgi:hypothetical protein
MDMPDIVDRFFAEARRVGLDDSHRLDFAASEMLQIAEDPAHRLKFIRLFKSQTNDDELQRMIEMFVLDLADDFDAAARSDDRGVDGLDRSVAPVAIGIGVLGVGTTIAAYAAGGAIIGPAGALAGGTIGLVLYTYRRSALKRRADNIRIDQGKRKRLVGK